MTDTTDRATGTFKIAGWDEQPWAEAKGAPKLTHASVTTTYRGDLEAEGTAGLLMLYDGSDAAYGGYERIVGTLGGRSGSFVLRLDGGFEEGTGTGELAGLRGQGGYVAGQGEAEIGFELRWSLGT